MPSRRLPAIRRRLAATGVMLAVVSAGFAADLLWLKSSVIFTLLVSVVAGLVVSEFYGMCRRSGETPFKAFGVGASVMLVWLHWLTIPKRGSGPFGELVISEEFLWAGLVLVIFGVVALQAMKRDNDRIISSIAVTLLGIMYVWFLSTFLVRMRHLGADGTLGGTDWNATGAACVIACIMITKIGDVGAYLGGSLLGRHRLIPRISPGKSWEGAIIGLLFSVAMTVAWGHAGRSLLPFLTAPKAVAFGLLVGVCAQCGDLAESLLKRGTGVKDAGMIVPGFGGLLDVVDSLLTGAPVSYFLYKVMMTP